MLVKDLRAIRALAVSSLTPYGGYSSGGELKSTVPAKESFS